MSTLIESGSDRNAFNGQPKWIEQYNLILVLPSRLLPDDEFTMPGLRRCIERLIAPYRYIRPNSLLVSCFTSI